MSTPVVIPPEAFVPPEEVRPTPDVDPLTLAEINATLDALPVNAAGATFEVPRKGVYQLAAYYNTGGGFSFYAWGKVVDGNKGGGVAVRKVFGGRG